MSAHRQQLHRYLMRTLAAVDSASERTCKRPSAFGEVHLPPINSCRLGTSILDVLGFLNTPHAAPVPTRRDRKP